MVAGKKPHKFSEKLSIACPVTGCQENYQNISDELICNSEWSISGGLFLQDSRRAFWTAWLWFYSNLGISLQQGSCWDAALDTQTRPWDQHGREGSWTFLHCTCALKMPSLKEEGNKRISVSCVIWEVLAFISFKFQYCKKVRCDNKFRFLFW